MICVLQVTPGPTPPNVRFGPGPLFYSAPRDMLTLLLTCPPTGEAYASAWSMVRIHLSGSVNLVRPGGCIPLKYTPSIKPNQNGYIERFNGIFLIRAFDQKSIENGIWIAA
jgi:hypothetical protein